MAELLKTHPAMANKYILSDANLVEEAVVLRKIFYIQVDISNNSRSSSIRNRVTLWYRVTFKIYPPLDYGNI